MLREQQHCSGSDTPWALTPHPSLSESTHHQDEHRTRVTHDHCSQWLSCGTACVPSAAGIGHLDSDHSRNRTQGSH